MKQTLQSIDLTGKNIDLNEVTDSTNFKGGMQSREIDCGLQVVNI